MRRIKGLIRALFGRKRWVYANGGHIPAMVDSVTNDTGFPIMIHSFDSDSSGRVRDLEKRVQVLEERLDET